MPDIITRHTRRQPSPAARAAAEDALPAAARQAAYDAITQWQGYAETPLRHLREAAAARGIGGIYYKDEAGRFGLGSFKALGGAYALEYLLKQHIAAGGAAATFTAATATDGNHGKAVAWGAARSSCAAKIFIHREVSAARAGAIAAYGADIIRINGNYDDSLDACREQSARYGWQIISDASWRGYTDIPRLIMAGYAVMMREALRQLAEQAATPTHIIAPAGVGGLAGAVVAELLTQTADTADTQTTPPPRIIIVESEHSDCLRQSAEANEITRMTIERETAMAGLSCGEASLLAWRILADSVSDFVAISDNAVGDITRELAAAGVVAGECATAGLAVLSGAAGDNDNGAKWREALGLNADSIALVFGSEGATDAQNYNRLLAGGEA